MFAYWSFQLKLETSFGDLLPQTHPFIQIHNKYAGTFGGANNVQLMVEVKDGNIFNVPTLARIYKITEAVDQVYGVNHNQIDSIGHRTTRYLRAQSGGFLRAEPVMIGLPKTPEDAANIRRIVHNTESVYGILVSLDDARRWCAPTSSRAASTTAARSPSSTSASIAPFEKGWFGALIKGKDPLKPDQPSPAVIEVVYRDTPAAKPGSRPATSSCRSTASETPDRSRSRRGHAAPRPRQRGHARRQARRRAGDRQDQGPEPDISIYVAGEPRLYGWIYSYAGDVFWIFTVTWCFEWLLRWMYFHDWRGALRPTLTGIIAAFWGLGFIHLIGFALDPLILVMPFLITARAVSHAIQMHDRYYEEYERNNWDQRKAIVGAFAELFVPTFSGILTDAFGVLVVMLVPIVMLRKLAIVASWWILAITISEMLLNPIVYYYLRAPDKDVVLDREKGWYRAAHRLVHRARSSRSGGKIVTMVFWAVLTAVGRVSDARPDRG